MINSSCTFTHKMHRPAGGGSAVVQVALCAHAHLVCYLAKCATESCTGLLNPNTVNCCRYSINVTKAYG